MSKLTRFRNEDAEGQPASAGSTVSITRRSFLRGISVAGLAATGASGLVGLLAGCGGEQGQPNPTHVPGATSLTILVRDGGSTSTPPLAGATVTLVGSGVSATTNSSGIAYFPNLANGNYSVTVSDAASPNSVGGAGYITQTVGNISVSNGPSARSIVLVPLGVIGSSLSGAPNQFTPSNGSVPAITGLPGGLPPGVTLGLTTFAPNQGSIVSQDNNGNPTIHCLPLGPSVEIQIRGGNGLTDGNISAGAALTLPLYIYPLQSGLQVPVNYLDTSSFTNGTLTATVDGTGHAVSIPLSSIPNNLRRAGENLVFSLPTFCFTPSLSQTVTNVTSPGVTDSNCSGTAPLTLDLYFKEPGSQVSPLVATFDGHTVTIDSVLVKLISISLGADPTGEFVFQTTIAPGYTETAYANGTVTTLTGVATANQTFFSTSHTLTVTGSGSFTVYTTGTENISRCNTITGGSGH